MKFEPIIKWTGTKRSQSEEIINLIPMKKYEIYYEPFCGSCSVLFQLLNSYKKLCFSKFICSDLNEDLINLWNDIKTKPSSLINDRQAKGSHEIWYHPERKLRTTIPNHSKLLNFFFDNLIIHFVVNFKILNFVS